MEDCLRLKIIFPITAGLDDSEEVSEVQRIQMGLKDGDQYETELGVYNLVLDPFIHLNPKCFLPKDKGQKKYYTEVVFNSGNIVYADGKPEKVYEKIQEYLKTIPEEK